jgi:ketosteroid isomerase-like protein
MSEENVEVIRATFDAFGRGDVASILKRCDPDITFTEAAAMPGAQTFHGHQGVRDAFAHWAGQWDDFSRRTRTHSRRR